MEIGSFLVIFPESVVSIIREYYLSVLCGIWNELVDACGQRGLPLLRAGSEMAGPLSAASVQSLQMQLKRSLNLPGFTLPSDLSELLGLANGLESPSTALLEGTLWPSDVNIRLIASSGSYSIPLYAVSTQSATQAAFKYDLISGCVYHIQQGATVVGSPLVVFCSLRHLFQCVSACVRRYEPSGPVSGAVCSFLHAALFSQLIKRPQLKTRFEEFFPFFAPVSNLELLEGHFNQVGITAFLIHFFLKICTFLVFI